MFPRTLDLRNEVCYHKVTIFRSTLSRANTLAFPNKALAYLARCGAEQMGGANLLQPLHFKVCQYKSSINVLLHIVEAWWVSPYYPLSHLVRYAKPYSRAHVAQTHSKHCKKPQWKGHIFGQQKMLRIAFCVDLHMPPTCFYPSFLVAEAHGVLLGYKVKNMVGELLELSCDTVLFPLCLPSNALLYST